MTITPGQALGKYRIDAEIGRGGMGIVYRGFDAGLRRTVAIKVLPPELTLDPEFVQRFRQEAVIAAGLHHPGIVSIFDVGQDKGAYYLVMEYLDGVTLDQHVARRGALPLTEVDRIVRAVAAALDYAHERGVVHRDVKPTNIMVARDGRVTLMDFGLVRAGEGTSLTRAGTLIGTPEYMSPEQALGAAVDHRSDIYSLGIVIYKMLVGKVPFSRSTPLATSYAQVHETPPPLRQVRGDLNPAVQAVIDRALAKRPDARYQRAGLLAADLGRAISGELPLVRKTTPAEAPPKPREVPNRTGQDKPPGWLPVAGGGLLLLLVAALVWFAVAPRNALPSATTPPPATQKRPTSTLGVVQRGASATSSRVIAATSTMTLRPTFTSQPVASTTLLPPTVTPRPGATSTWPAPTAAPTPSQPAQASAPVDCMPWHRQPKPGYGIVLIENHLGDELSVDYAVGGSGHYMLAAKRGEEPGRLWFEVPVGTHVFNYSSARYRGRATFHVADGGSYTSPLWLNERSEDYVFPMEVPAGCR